jgi:aspartokinase/homoserine dehydrogenase 1
MQVLKFGGTSVANAENINKVAGIIKTALLKDQTIVVVSAFGGVTDMLLQCGNLAARADQSYKQLLQEITQRHLSTIKALLPLTTQSSILSQVMQQCNEIEDVCNGVFLLKELSARTKDKIVSYGELLSSQIISSYLSCIEIKNASVDTRKLIITDSNFTKANVDFNSTNKNIQEYFRSSSEKLFIVPGFVSSDVEGFVTTLGRGGSDFTAAIFGAALNAKLVEIWTDVSGMMTADPRLVPNAKAISSISYHEAMELSHFGAKVIYPPTIQPLLRNNIEVWIKNTFSPDDHGTVIKSVAEQVNGNIIRGISSIDSISLLSLEGSSMDEATADKAKLVVDNAFGYELETGKVNPLIVEKNLAIVALVGDNMKSHPGTSGKMFGALGRNGVNVRAIAQGSSERNISAVIASEDVKKAINVLHEEFFETTYKQVNLFVVGTGNVGSKLLGQLHQQQQYLADHLRLQINVAGIANSKKMAFNDDGIDLGSWKTALQNGKEMNIDDFVGIVQSKNLRNAVFVDITANEGVASVYDRLFEKSVSIVACNKIACSSPYAHYKKLKDLAREHNAAFHFETNVGASLPIIGALNDLLRSGDEVKKIQAVLSGTLNFVFNNYDTKRSFAEVVRQAQKEGYTEPDPRLDLSGKDVMRKIMILAREAGEKLEMEDISNTPFMPESCMVGSVEDFYKEMENQEEHFKSIYKAAEKEEKKLKFVAQYENGKASVGLQHIDRDHDFYHLYGKDNIVLFYTNRYIEQPMVVKGAGAGAEVTASGVFADIIRAARI